MVEKNAVISHYNDSIVHNINGSVDESLRVITENDLDEIPNCFIDILERFLSILICGYEIVKSAKNDTQFACNIGLFRTKYRDQAGVEKSVLTTFFEKQNVAMLLGAC